MAERYRSLPSQDDFWEAYDIDTIDRPQVGLTQQQATLEEVKLRTDRRHQTRQEVSCRVDYADSKRSMGIGLITNLSRDGLFMDYVPGLATGEAVTAAFRLPGSPPFKLRGVVKWVNTQGAGLKFEGLSQQVIGIVTSQEAENISAFRSWWCQS
jgi:hypothetical protein